MLIWLATVILAAASDYTEVKQTDGCTLYKGPTSDQGVSPMRARCHWPDVQPDALWAMLDSPEDYTDTIFAISQSAPQRTQGDRTLVHQVQAIRGIADREVLIWMRWETTDQARTVSWTTAAAQPLEVHPDRVRMARNDGSWVVSAHPEGGTLVVHDVTVFPGGSVPSWIVRWVSVGGLSAVMSEVREKASVP